MTRNWTEPVDDVAASLAALMKFHGGPPARFHWKTVRHSTLSGRAVRNVAANFLQPLAAQLGAGVTFYRGWFTVTPARSTSTAPRRRRWLEVRA